MLHQTAKRVPRQSTYGTENYQEKDSQTLLPFRTPAGSTKKLLIARWRPGVISPYQGRFRRTPSPCFYYDYYTTEKPGGKLPCRR